MIERINLEDFKRLSMETLSNISLSAALTEVSQEPHPSELKVLTRAHIKAVALVARMKVQDLEEVREACTKAQRNNPEGYYNAANWSQMRTRLQAEMKTGVTQAYIYQVGQGLDLDIDLSTDRATAARRLAQRVALYVTQLQKGN